MTTAERDLGHGAAERGCPGLHRRCLAHGGAVAELARLIVSPAPECAVGLARAAMTTAERDLGHGVPERGCPGLHRRCLAHGGAVAELAKGIVSPAPGGAVGLARAAMTSAERDLGHGAAERGCPGPHRRCLAHGGAVAELAKGIVSPAPEGAVGLARAAMTTAERDLGHGAAERGCP